MTFPSPDFPTPTAFSWRGGTIHLQPKEDLDFIYWEISGRCNFDCPMCFRKTFDVQPDPGLLPIDAFVRVLDELDSRKIRTTMMLGGLGEPMTHPHFSDFVKLIKARGHRLEISTNGSLIDASMARFLVQSGTDRIALSSEPGGLGHPHHDHLQKTLAMLKSAQNQKNSNLPQLDVVSVVHQQNIGEIPSFIRSFTTNQSGQRTITRLIFSHLLPFQRQHVPWVLYPSLDDPFDDRPYTIPDPNRPEIIAPESVIRTDRTCPFMEKRAAVIRWDGKVSPCYYFLHSMKPYVMGRKKQIQPKHFGSILEKPLLTIWKDPQYLWFRYRVGNQFFPSCPDCAQRAICSFVDSNEYDCWSNTPSCADCLWWRRILICP